MLWRNEYLSRNSIFPDRVSAASRRQKFSLFQKFSTCFLFSPTQALLAYSQLYWIIGLSHYSLHPVPWEMKKYNREKILLFVTRRKYACIKVQVCLVLGNWIETETEAFLPDWSRRSIDKRLRYQYAEQDLSQQDIPDAKLESWCTPFYIVLLQIFVIVVRGTINCSLQGKWCQK